MKILYHHRIGSKDGQYVHIAELQRAIRDLGHEIVTVEPTSFSKRGFGADARVVQGLRQSIPGWANELMEGFYSLIDYARVRRVILEHRPDCIYDRYNLFTPSCAWAKRRFRLPLAVEVNAPLFEERSRFGGITLKRFARWTERTVWRTADYVLPVTDVLGGYVERAGVDSSRIVTIPNGVNLDEFQRSPAGNPLRKQLGLDGKLVLGFTGFVREWHGLDRAADVLAKLRDRIAVHLLVVGHGPGCDALKDRAKQLGVDDDVTITGIIGRERIAQFIDLFDVALQPDVVEYASPLKLFEYLAMGKAVVAPDRENIREILRDDVTAVLFDPGDPAAFGRAVIRLCDDAGFRERLGEAAHRLVLDRDLTWAANARRVMKLFAETKRAPKGGTG